MKKAQYILSILIAVIIVITIFVVLTKKDVPVIIPDVAPIAAEVTTTPPIDTSPWKE